MKCVWCGRRAVHRHHILYRQWFRRELHGDMNDPRNTLPLCAACHARHHSAFRRLPRRLLSSEALQFANEVGGMSRIERTYPEDIE